MDRPRCAWIVIRGNPLFRLLYDSIVTSFKWWYSFSETKAKVSPNFWIYLNKSCSEISEIFIRYLVARKLNLSVCLSPVFDDLFDVAMFDVISGRSLECQGVSCMISGTLMISFLFCRHKNILKVQLFNFLSLHRCTISYTMNGCQWVHMSV